MKKENPKLVVSCEFCEIFSNAYVVEHVQMAASEMSNTGSQEDYISKKD